MCQKCKSSNHARPHVFMVCCVKLKLNIEKSQCCVPDVRHVKSEYDLHMAMCVLTLLINLCICVCN